MRYAHLSRINGDGAKALSAVNPVDVERLNGPQPARGVPERQQLLWTHTSSRTPIQAAQRQRS
jgi:hypothetical protein